MLGTSSVEADEEPISLKKVIVLQQREYETILSRFTQREGWYRDGEMGCARKNLGVFVVTRYPPARCREGI